ncbi:hypothetical protein K1T71_009613 [Dendrolimus kikuchii]|uniref:Uncharacterized protein n=1 Tax=Dendrolimus kikuchii TaxID=765133 RepID=A0ACC1CSK9_9NEOP|nr:hypothetical protein K1T71_009613 [Dendrolimus kikuchii]
MPYLSLSKGKPPLHANYIYGLYLGRMFSHVGRYTSDSLPLGPIYIVRESHRQAMAVHTVNGLIHTLWRQKLFKTTRCHWVRAAEIFISPNSSQASCTSVLIWDNHYYDFFTRPNFRATPLTAGTPRLLNSLAIRKGPITGRSRLEPRLAHIPTNTR